MFFDARAGHCTSEALQVSNLRLQNALAFFAILRQQQLQLEENKAMLHHSHSEL